MVTTNHTRTDTIALHRRAYVQDLIDEYIRPARSGTYIVHPETGMTGFPWVTIEFRNVFEGQDVEGTRYTVTPDTLASAFALVSGAVTRARAEDRCSGALTRPDGTSLGLDYAAGWRIHEAYTTNGRTGAITATHMWIIMEIAFLGAATY